jgi:hypothetical protein
MSIFEIVPPLCGPRRGIGRPIPQVCVPFELAARSADNDLTTARAGIKHNGFKDTFP